MDIEKGQLMNKQYAVNIKNINDEEKIITFLGTTNSKDRDGDIIDPKGGNLNNFRKNPVFLWGHDWAGARPPIGRSVEERIMDKGIEFDIKFDKDDTFAMQVYNKYKNNFLNAVSVGFAPNDYEKMTNDEGKFTGYKFTDWELLELSAVPIPANPEALQRMAKSLSDDVEKEINEMIEETKEEPEESVEKEEEKEPKFSVKDIELALNLIEQASNEEKNQPHKLDNKALDILGITDKAVKDKIEYLAGKIIDK